MIGWKWWLWFFATLDKKCRFLNQSSSRRQKIKIVGFLFPFHSHSWVSNDIYIWQNRLTREFQCQRGSSSIWFQYWKSHKVGIFLLDNYLTRTNIFHNSENISSFTHFTTCLSHISSWSTNNSTNCTLSIGNFLKLCEQFNWNFELCSDVPSL